jgi:hypothetical protein
VRRIRLDEVTAELVSNARSVLVGDATVYAALLTNPCGSAPFASWGEPKDDLLIEVPVLHSQAFHAAMAKLRELGFEGFSPFPGSKQV